MTTPEGTAAPASPDDPQQLAEEIERTRQRLGETVEALAAKTDVKARAQEKANQLTTRLKGKANQAREQIKKRPMPVAASAGAVVAVVMTIVLIKRWRRQ